MGTDLASVWFPFAVGGGFVFSFFSSLPHPSGKEAGEYLCGA